MSENVQIDRVVYTLHERIYDARKSGAHEQYIEGLWEALDIIRDEME